MRDQGGSLSVAKNGCEWLGMDGGHWPIDGYWHLEMDEQVEVSGKEWIEVIGSERMGGQWCSVARNKWKLVARNGCGSVVVSR